jgi:hypothetical protein
MDIVLDNSDKQGEDSDEMIPSISLTLLLESLIKI